MHHLGIGEEQFPDDVANAIYTADITTNCNTLPVDDPFNPNSCQGQPMTFEDAVDYFSPAGSSAPLGTYKLYARRRMCREITGCKEWKEFDLHYSAAGSPSKPLKKEGKVHLFLDNYNKIGVDFYFLLMNGRLGQNKVLKCKNVLGRPNLNCKREFKVNALNLSLKPNLKSFVINKHCIRSFSRKGREQGNTHVSWIEYEAVILSKF